MTYAEKTKVPIGRTKNEIECLVKKNGAENFGILSQRKAHTIVFTINDVNIMFRFETEDSPQAERSIWRAVMMTIKMKFESIERGIEPFEEAFLAQVVAPDGKTYGEHVIPSISSDYEAHRVPLLPEF